MLRGEWADPRLGRTSFNEWADRWLDSTVNLRANTKAGYRSILGRYLRPAFGSYPLGRINALAVRSWLEEATGHYRTLAQARPDVFLPDLAMALNNLSGRLAGLGRREEGLAAIEEATGHYRTLAQARPDVFLPDLAMALNNLSGRLGDLGRYEDALAAKQEADAIQRRLDDA